MDVLTDVLETVRVRTACYGRLELGAPWGFRIDASDDAKFHVVLRGSCLLKAEGLEKPLSLTSGDLVVLPHGTEHVVKDSLESEERPITEVFEKAPCNASGTITVSGTGATTTLVCGLIRFEDRQSNPLLGVLPTVMPLMGDTGRAVPWLESTLQFIACEAAAGRPGAQTVISRLADILFIQIVRGYLTVEQPAPGWLGALRDPQIGAALGAIHQNPEQPFTVAHLATQVGMSRSAFAARFTELVGEPPLQYVTRWRMHRAARLLRDGRATLAEIAVRVGYESEASFSKAFKRSLGASPGAYRKASKIRPAAAVAN